MLNVSPRQITTILANNKKKIIYKRSILEIMYYMTRNSTDIELKIIHYNTTLRQMMQNKYILLTYIQKHPKQHPNLLL